MSDSCVFCKIITGDIPSNCVYEDDDFKVILDIAPASKGHCIIIPKKHMTDAYDIDEYHTSKVYGIAVKMAKALKEVLKCDGINILQNNESAAGQTVFHFHMHVIPRFHEDDINLSWKHVGYGNGEVEDLKLKLKELI